MTHVARDGTALSRPKFKALLLWWNATQAHGHDQHPCGSLQGEPRAVGGGLRNRSFRAAKGANPDVASKDVTWTMTYPDGREEVVLRVPRFDYNWQILYRTRLTLPGGCAPVR